jgi:V8-like Glu-specific endopeptidase
MFVVAAMLALAGCEQQLPGEAPEATRDEGIIGGTVDTGDPAVALLVFSGSQGSYVCTGTLISEDTILTAGHCSVKNDSCSGSACVANPASGYIVLGGTYPIDANWEIKDPTWSAEVTSVHPHPAYGSGANGAPVHDVAIFKIAPIQVYSGTKPQPLAWLSTLNSAAFTTGNTFKAVGYGVTNGSSGAGTGTKRKVTLAIGGHNNTEFWYGGNGTNTCSGDSGGPAIATVNGVPTVIGTTSYGDYNCTQDGVNMRVDAERAFLSQYATPSAPGGGSTSWSGSVSPALATVDNGQVCSSLTVNGSGNAADVKLDVSGVHDYRSILRATLSHGGVTAEAFPVGTFSNGAGSFSLSAAAIGGFSGSATGNWTLCLVDTDAYGDTGTLAGWSVRN